MFGKEYIIVDGKMTAASSYDSTKETNAHAAIDIIENYKQKEIDLSDLLLDRALYLESDTTTGKSVAALTDADSKLWTLHSVTNFEIDSANITFERLSGLTIQNAIVTKSIKYDATTNAPPVRVVPKVTGNIAIDANLIDRFTEQNKVDFWAETHIMSVPLKLVSAVSNRISEVTVRIPIRFIPAKPKILTIPSTKLRLNITSTNIYNYNNGNGKVLNAEGDTTDDADYGAIYIRPSDLIEYSKPASYVETCFDHLYTSIDTYDSIHNERIQIDRMKAASAESATLVEDEGDSASAVPKAYRIKAMNNSRSNVNYTIRFRVLYYTGTTTSSEQHEDISINISTYGGYTVEFNPIMGKDSASYNVLTSDNFGELVKDGYTLTRVMSLNPEQLTASLDNNVVTLRPNVDVIKGQTVAKVRLFFTNSNGQTLTLDSEDIAIDVNAGSLFSRFDDWQAWLIIAACILGGILLVLLLVWLVF
ncbi:MAG: hypothetical protein K2L88_05020, partial [Clostridiales bacterium]|nr:hypothetical protein [Clostridiales bacterium]